MNIISRGIKRVLDTGAQAPGVELQAVWNAGRSWLGVTGRS